MIFILKKFVSKRREKSIYKAAIRSGSAESGIAACKASFLLLEVIVALAIVALCAYPLLSPHFFTFKKQIELAEKSQLQNWAELSFLEIEQKLYDLKGKETEEFNWTSFENEKERKLESPAIVYLGEGKSNLFERYYSLSFKEKELDLRKEDLRLLEVKIWFPRKENSPHQYSFTTIIAKE